MCVFKSLPKVLSESLIKKKQDKEYVSQTPRTTYLKHKWIILIVNDHYFISESTVSCARHGTYPAPSEGQHVSDYQT